MKKLCYKNFIGNVKLVKATSQNDKYCIVSVEDRQFGKILELEVNECDVKHFRFKNVCDSILKLHEIFGKFNVPNKLPITETSFYVILIYDHKLVGLHFYL